MVIQEVSANIFYQLDYGMTIHVAHRKDILILSDRHSRNAHRKIHLQVYSFFPGNSCFSRYALVKSKHADHNIMSVHPVLSCFSQKNTHTHTKNVSNTYNLLIHVYKCDITICILYYTTPHHTTLYTLHHTSHHTTYTTHTY